MTTLAILGPTASGKSALALDVARRRLEAGAPTELVAIDAFTVYRGMDVGTAKPDAEERREVTHHLVDVLDPWEALDVVWFRDRARAVIGEIRRRGATPLLVGGSGLYWRAVVDDLVFPPTDPTVRGRIEDEAARDPVAVHARLASLDPPAARTIPPENLRRVVRALEVIELTGQRFSTADDAWSRHVSIYDDLDVTYLEPEVSVLRARIEQRARRMVDEGLLTEAAALRALPRPLSRTAAQAIGYAEAFEVLDGVLPEQRLVTAIASRTWRYAKRQRSWFRADPRCRRS